MKTITVQELRKNLRAYIDRATNGEEFLILDGERPVARLVPPGAAAAEAEREHRAKRL
jgi:antitoxin (DNA-binding transcriptional repressor) of toxin-antitoxin stability system